MKRDLKTKWQTAGAREWQASRYFWRDCNKESAAALLWSYTHLSGQELLAESRAVCHENGCCGALQSFVGVFHLFYAFFWVVPRGLNYICRRFGTLCLFHLHRQVVWSVTGEQSGYLCRKRFDSPGNYPKENIIYSEHGESLKSRIDDIN